MARAWGVSPSVLMGRVVRDGDPQWLQEDTDLAIAFTDIEDMQCPGCGHDRSQSMDMANTFAYRAEPAKCHACAARERAARSRAKDPNWDPSGVRWTTTLQVGDGNA